MTDPIPDPAPDDEPGMPGWVKTVLALIVLAAVALLVLKLTGVGGGMHGPSRHG